jgi:hypothetical protein
MFKKEKDFNYLNGNPSKSSYLACEKKGFGFP